MLKSKTQKFAALITGFIFLFTQNAIPSFAQNSQLANAASLPSLSSARIQIPAEFGEIVETYHGTKPHTVLLIQDAHAIPDAQKNIANIVKYFRSQNGIPNVYLEGASGDLDPQIFQSFPEQKLLRQVMKGYLDAGEIAGGAAAAIFDSPKSEYRGIEDWDKYEEALTLYLRADERRADLLPKIAAAKKILDSEKKNQYSPELLRLDALIEKFYENAGEISELIKSLGEIQQPEKGSQIETLWKEIRQADQVSPESRDAEIRSISNKVHSLLETKDRTALKEFNSKKQSWMTGAESSKTFAAFLKSAASKYGVQLEMSNELLGMVRDERRLKEIEGTTLLKDLESYIETVKQSLFAKSERPSDLNRLDKLAASLRLLSSFVNLEIPRSKWDLIKDKTADALQLSVFGFAQSDLAEHFAFYAGAEERDRVFYEEISKGNTDAIFVAGGFHAEGVTSRLKAAGISYALITPKISHIPENVTYREQMRGEVSWKNYFKVENGRINLFKAFVRATRDRLMERSDESGAAGKDLGLLKNWRDQIIRDLADRGQIERAEFYTRFIDEVLDQKSGGRGRNENLTQMDSLLTKIDGFIRGLRGLDKINQLNAGQIEKLLKANMVPQRTAASSFVPGAAFVPRAESRSVGAAPAAVVRSADIRSEVRDADQQNVSLSRKWTLMLPKGSALSGANAIETADRAVKKAVAEHLNELIAVVGGTVIPAEVFDNDFSLKLEFKEFDGVYMLHQATFWQSQSDDDAWQIEAAAGTHLKVQFRTPKFTDAVVDFLREKAKGDEQNAAKTDLLHLRQPTGDELNELTQLMDQELKSLLKLAPDADHEGSPHLMNPAQFTESLVNVEAAVKARMPQNQKRIEDLNQTGTALAATKKINENKLIKAGFIPAAGLIVAAAAIVFSALVSPALLSILAGGTIFLISFVMLFIPALNQYSDSENKLKLHRSDFANTLNLTINDPKILNWIVNYRANVFPVLIAAWKARGRAVIPVPAEGGQWEILKGADSDNKSILFKPSSDANASFRMTWVPGKQALEIWNAEGGKVTEYYYKNVSPAFHFEQNPITGMPQMVVRAEGYPDLIASTDENGAQYSISDDAKRQNLPAGARRIFSSKDLKLNEKNELSLTDPETKQKIGRHLETLQNAFPEYMLADNSPMVLSFISDTRGFYYLKQVSMQGPNAGSKAWTISSAEGADLGVLFSAAGVFSEPALYLTETRAEARSQPAAVSARAEARVSKIVVPTFTRVESEIAPYVMGEPVALDLADGRITPEVMLKMQELNRIAVSFNPSKKSSFSIYFEIDAGNQASAGDQVKAVRELIVSNFKFGDGQAWTWPIAFLAKIKSGDGKTRYLRVERISERGENFVRLDKPIDPAWIIDVSPGSAVQLNAEEKEFAGKAEALTARAEARLLRDAAIVVTLTALSLGFLSAAVMWESNWLTNSLALSYVLGLMKNRKGSLEPSWRLVVSSGYLWAAVLNIGFMGNFFAGIMAFDFSFIVMRTLFGKNKRSGVEVSPDSVQSRPEVRNGNETAGAQAEFRDQTGRPTPRAEARELVLVDGRKISAAYADQQIVSVLGRMVEILSSLSSFERELPNNQGRDLIAKALEQTGLKPSEENIASVLSYYYEMGLPDNFQGADLINPVFAGLRKQSLVGILASFDSGSDPMTDILNRVDDIWAVRAAQDLGLSGQARDEFIRAFAESLAFGHSFEILMRGLRANQFELNEPQQEKLRKIAGGIGAVGNKITEGVGFYAEGIDAGGEAQIAQLLDEVGFSADEKEYILGHQSELPLRAEARAPVRELRAARSEARIDTLQKIQRMSDRVKTNIKDLALLAVAADEAVLLRPKFLLIFPDEYFWNEVVLLNKEYKNLTEKRPFNKELEPQADAYLDWLSVFERKVSNFRYFLLSTKLTLEGGASASFADLDELSSDILQDKSANQSAQRIAHVADSLFEGVAGVQQWPENLPRPLNNHHFNDQLAQMRKEKLAPLLEQAGIASESLDKALSNLKSAWEALRAQTQFAKDTTDFIAWGIAREIESDERTKEIERLRAEGQRSTEAQRNEKWRATDYYGTLGFNAVDSIVKAGVITDLEIKQAFRRLITGAHSDKVGGSDQEAAAIIEAYEVLKDQRADYDSIHFARAELRSMPAIAAQADAAAPVRELRVARSEARSPDSGSKLNAGWGEPSKSAVVEFAVKPGDFIHLDPPQKRGDVAEYYYVVGEKTGVNKDDAGSFTFTRYEKKKGPNEAAKVASSHDMIMSKKLSKYDFTNSDGYTLWFEFSKEKGLMLVVRQRAGIESEVTAPSPQSQIMRRSHGKWRDVNFYAVLEVNNSATSDEIKDARDRAVKPLAGVLTGAVTNPDDVKRLQDINDAYEVLGDPQFRAQYDAVRAGRAELRSAQILNDVSLAESAVALQGIVDALTVIERFDHEQQIKDKAKELGEGVSIFGERDRAELWDQINVFYASPQIHMVFHPLMKRAGARAWVKLLLMNDDQDGREYVEDALPIKVLTDLSREFYFKRVVKSDDQAYMPQKRSFGVGTYAMVLPHEAAHWVFANVLPALSGSTVSDTGIFWDGHFGMREKIVPLDAASSPHWAIAYQKLIGAKSPQFIDGVGKEKRMSVNENFSYNFERMLAGLPFIVADGASTQAEELIGFFYDIGVISDVERDVYIELNKRISGNDGRGIKTMSQLVVHRDVDVLGDINHIRASQLAYGSAIKRVIEAERIAGRELDVPNEITARIGKHVLFGESGRVGENVNDIEAWLKNDGDRQKLVDLMKGMGVFDSSLEKKIETYVAAISNQSSQVSVKPAAEAAAPILIKVMKGAAEAAAGAESVMLVIEVAGDQHEAAIDALNKALIEAAMQSGSNVLTVGEEFQRSLYTAALTNSLKAGASNSTIVLGVLKSLDGFGAQTLTGRVIKSLQDSGLSGRIAVSSDQKELAAALRKAVTAKNLSFSVSGLEGEVRTADGSIATIADSDLVQGVMQGVMPFALDLTDVKPENTMARDLAEAMQITLSIHAARILAGKTMSAVELKAELLKVLQADPVFQGQQDFLKIEGNKFSIQVSALVQIITAIRAEQRVASAA